MKFYDRKKEIALLRDIEITSRESAQMTIVTGRRRIGKTTLLLKAFEGSTMLYFFVAKKAEKALCEGFTYEIEDKLGIPQIGGVANFSEIFEYLMKLSIDRHFTLFIDEFQDFMRINPSIFSDIQRIWDLYAHRSKINIVLSGSIHRTMERIFKNESEPLYNRHSHFLAVKPFDIDTLKDILKEYNRNYTPDDLLAMYTFTGGVAKYIQILMENGATTCEKMIDTIISRDSFFLDEGRNLLVEEFGKDYGVYFTILSAIASGNTERKEIEHVIGKDISGYLTNLDDHYGLIVKNQPIFEKTANKGVRYRLRDNFLTFWFRFIFKYNYILEIGAYEQLRRIVNRDYPVLSGFMLERYFKQKLAETQMYTRIGSWWDRKGGSKIDIVAENEIDKRAEFIEVKKNPKKYSESVLDEKVDTFLSSTHAFGGYSITTKSLSLCDM